MMDEVSLESTAEALTHLALELVYTPDEGHLHFHFVKLLGVTYNGI